MSKRKKSRRRTSERKLRFYRIAKDFCSSHSLPAPAIQFKNSSCGYIVKTRTIELKEDEKVENFYHALGHHKYFLNHRFRDSFMKRFSRVCTISGISLIYFERMNPLLFLLFLVPYGHYVYRQFFAERYVPKEMQTTERWMRLLAPFGN
jgi:hypothetical protein